MKIAPICLLSLAVLASSADAQTMYRWVDKEGKVHYSDQPPPKEIKKVERPRLGNSTIETSGLSYEAQKAARDFPVTIYTTPDCAAECKMARDYLAKRGIPYSEKSLTSNDEIVAFRDQFKVDNVFVPAITVGSQQRQGFEETAWSGMLDTAGYPRSAIPGSVTRPAPAAQ
ncbi:MAG: glutaredoxin family protein [Denitratisoma sp.]|nr:glutaredoxin family protein [Denitratisoma sp.]